jgi:hypothetical protein
LQKGWWELTEESEVKVRVGFDDSQFKSGMSRALDDVKRFVNSSKFSLDELHEAFHSLALGAHLFGATMAIRAVSHMKHMVTELAEWIDETFGDVVSEKVKKRLEDLEKIMERITEKRKELSQKKEDIRFEALPTAQKIDELEAKKDEMQGEDGLVASKMHAAQDAAKVARLTKERWGADDIRTKEAEETAAQFKLAYEEAKLKVDQITRDIHKYSNELRKEEDAEQKKDDAEQEADDKKRAEELHRLKMYHKEKEHTIDQKNLEIKKIQEQEDKSFQPTAKQILNSGSWWKHKFRSSWAANQEADIENETESIQEDRANFGMSDDLKDRINRVQQMKSELNKFLGVNGTPEERIAEATTKAEKHLSDIRDAFFKRDSE